MYYRISNSGQQVEWNPANESAAIQALIETSDTGVSAENEVSTEEKVELSRDVAESVKKRYKGLIIKKLVISSEDGEVEFEGASSETITTEIVNDDGDRHTGSYTATLLVDHTNGNSTEQVDIVDGVAELEITTYKNVGEVFTVQLVEFNESESVPPDKIELDVI